MDRPVPEPEIVVGVDGSAAALHATAWAAAEADARRGRLTLVHATGLGAPAAPGVEAVLDEAGDVARRGHPLLDVVTRVVGGDVLPALLDAAEDAQLVVAGLGPETAAGRGPVGVGLLGRASCPVVLVRRGDVVGGSSVVAAVDGSSADTAVLSAAFAAAAAHRLPLTVVRTGGEPSVPVASELRRWSGPYPRVAATVETVEGSSASVLARRSAGAAVLVVGTPRHQSPRPTPGSGAGSPAVDARCPVLVVTGGPSAPRHRPPDPALRSPRGAPASAR